MAIQCLGSLQRLSRANVRLQIHDDGSLTDDDAQELEQRLKPCRVISRAEADERMATLLAHHFRARWLRDRWPLALKLFDCFLLNDCDLLAFSDADILYMRPFVSMFELPPGNTTNAVLMEDKVDAYCLRSWQKLLSRNVTLPSRVNIGLFCFQQTHFDLDYLDWFVGERRHYGIPNHIAQGALAALGRRVGCRKYDPRQVRVMREGENTDELVAGHFTARTRHLLPRYVERSREVSPCEEPVKLRTVPAGECTALDLARYELRRLTSRIRG
jgi:hypothetical protein